MPAHLAEARYHILQYTQRTYNRTVYTPEEQREDHKDAHHNKVQRQNRGQQLYLGNPSQPDVRHAAHVHEQQRCGQYHQDGKYRPYLSFENRHILFCFMNICPYSKPPDSLSRRIFRRRYKNSEFIFYAHRHNTVFHTNFTGCGIFMQPHPPTQNAGTRADARMPASDPQPEPVTAVPRHAPCGPQAPPQ